jgi:hypothetical protein
LRVLREFFQEVPRVGGLPSAPENGTHVSTCWLPKLAYVNDKAAVWRPIEPFYCQRDQ